MLNPEDLEQERVQIAHGLGCAQAEIKRWEAYASKLKARLADLHSQGLVETKFTASGFTVSLQKGKAGIKVSPEGKMQQELFLLGLIDEGQAERTTGTPFWQVTAVKPPKATNKPLEPIEEQGL